MNLAILGLFFVVAFFVAIFLGSRIERRLYCESVYSLGILFATIGFALCVPLMMTMTPGIIAVCSWTFGIFLGVGIGRHVYPTVRAWYRIFLRNRAERIAEQDAQTQATLEHEVAEMAAASA